MDHYLAREYRVFSVEEEWKPKASAEVVQTRGQGNSPRGEGESVLRSGSLKL